MSLENYLVKSRVPYEEILWDFRPEQVQQLYYLVKETGRQKYFAFVKEHLSDILKYISLSQSQRQQRKWVNHPQILLIRLAALQVSSATVDLLNELHPLAEIVDRGSYRQFHSATANALAPFLINFQLYSFPFEGYDNPFRS